MILIPEKQTVVILTPRTGSGSLCRAIVNTYPQAMLLYRHMEADGIPAGYDRWRKVGVIRHPLDRLWSLYKFCQDFDGPHDPAYIEKIRQSVCMPFSDWIVKNETVFTSPYDTTGAGRFFPKYTVRHPLPETRKSQFIYLRPDLGTKIFFFEQLDELEIVLSLTLPQHNQTPPMDMPVINKSAIEHMEQWFAWDYGLVKAFQSYRGKSDVQ